MFRRLILFPSWDEEGNLESSIQLMRSIKVPGPVEELLALSDEKDNFCL